MLDHIAEGPSKAAAVLVRVDMFFLCWIKNIQDEGSSQQNKKKEKTSIKHKKRNTGMHVEHLHVQILTQL